jgi:transcriptional regulator with XRE-family HTH domain
MMAFPRLYRYHETLEQLKAGDKIRKLRTKLGITTRQVDQFSRKIAIQESNEEFTVSHSRLTQIETGESTPSLYKLYSLGAIFGVSMSELISYYLDVGGATRFHMDLELPNTRLADFDIADTQQRIEFPIRFDPGFSVDKTNLLSRMVEVWGELPMAFLQHLDVRRSRYGFIGLGDYTMYPLLRPGSFVQIDERQRTLPAAASRTEYDRPIYFIELRDGYICSWCEVNGNRLLVIPHPLSPCRTKEFACPSEAEIIGRVTAVAARLAQPSPASSDSAKSPKQS